MKKLFGILWVAVLLAPAAFAALVSSSVENINAVIPDGNLNGIQSSLTLNVPDPRNIDPLSAGSAFDSASRSAMLSTFNGSNPNGQWTLFITDTSPGGEGALINWGLQIITVPEPSILTLLVFLGGLLATRSCL